MSEERPKRIEIPSLEDLDEEELFEIPDLTNKRRKINDDGTIVIFAHCYSRLFLHLFDFSGSEKVVLFLIEMSFLPYAQSITARRRFP
jgi:hypothetical protein